MKSIVHKSETRGLTSAGWLVGRHSFSFNRWYDPSRVQFGALRVLNDDLILPGQGFPPHDHADMEIITIPLKGSVAHEDSSGGKGVVAAGEVQIMSAGTGVTHSEFNASKSEPLELLQIWVLPERAGLPPRYEERNFIDSSPNEWRILASPNEEQGSLKIFQQAWFSRGLLDSARSISYKRKGVGTGIYVFVITGKVVAAGIELGRRDAVALTEVEEFDIISVEEPSDILLLEVPVS